METQKITFKEHYVLDILRDLIKGSGCKIISVVYIHSKTGVSFDHPFPDTIGNLLVGGDENHIEFFRYLLKKYKEQLCSLKISLEKTKNRKESKE